MYHFDFARITPLDWIGYGFYVQYNPVEMVMFIARKSATFDFDSIPYDMLPDVIEVFNKQFMDFLTVFIELPTSPADSPVMPDDNFDPNAFLRDILKNGRG